MKPFGYSVLQRQTLTGRALERAVLSRITARLESIDESEPGGGSRAAKALQDNRKLWMIVAADAAHATSPLNEQLRASLLSIAAFVENHTNKILSGSGSVDVLIDINRNIEAGLEEAAPMRAAAQ